MPIHGYPGNIITANPTAPTVSAASGVWTTEQQLQAVSQGNWPGYEYPISRSLRFNSADSAYLNRTFSAGSSTQWTMSFWCKISGLGTDRMFLNGGDGTQTNSTNDYVGFNTGDQIVFVRTGGVAGNWLRTFSPVYRDISAWYHFVLVSNLGSGTVADRLQLYVNGVRVTAYTDSSTVPNTSWPYLNGAYTHNIGRLNAGSGPYYSNFYLTEINFIDGQALTPSSFGLNDPETGIWSPKQYTGTYGTNGFYLNFSDNSNTTTATLGKDYSGNGNNWTPNNFSVTAGAGNDSLVDTPTSYGSDTGVGGEVRGNYCTWSPVDIPDPSGTTYTLTLSNGNLETATGGAEGFVNNTTLATFQIPTTGKWYWEILVTNVATLASTRTAIGIMNQAAKYADGVDFTYADVSGVYAYAANGQKATSPNLGLTNYGNSYTNNDVIGVAVDSDAGKIWFAKNGTWQNSGSPTGGTNEAFSGLVMSQGFQPAIGYWLGCTANFGQRPFAYTAPSGFKALCTQNLPTPTIGATSTTQANRYMDATLYTGTGVARNITNNGSMQPDLVWIKSRSTVGDTEVYDSVRGATKYLLTDSTIAEGTIAQSLTAFNSNGFALGTGSGGNDNTNGTTYVAWQWRASNAAGVSNTQGTITSTVSANTTAGFSIVTYTGTGVAATVGHGLGVAPSMIIAKRRSAAQNWGVAHSALTGTQTLYLDLTQGVATGVWNGTPTSTVFNITTDGVVNASGSTYVAYCFAEVAGYSAFGSYTGNGSTDGSFVYCGFRPRYVLMKRTDSAADWVVIDAVRNSYNAAGKWLLPNSSAAEYDYDASYPIDILSNGFKLRTSVGSINVGTFIFAAFAESPFKYALAR